MCSHTQQEEALSTASKRWRKAIRRVIRIQHVHRITVQLQSLRITWPGMGTGSTGRRMVTCTMSGDDGDEDDTADKGRVELVTLPSFLNVSPSSRYHHITMEVSDRSLTPSHLISSHMGVICLLLTLPLSSCSLNSHRDITIYCTAVRCSTTWCYTSHFSNDR